MMWQIKDDDDNDHDDYDDDDGGSRLQNTETRR